MRKLNYFFVIILMCTINTFAQVGIGTTTPEGALDIATTNSGLLIPRNALTSLTDITTFKNPDNGGNPVTSTLVYNDGTGGVATAGFYYWDGAKWVMLVTEPSTDWTILGNAGSNPATNFVGTTDTVDFVFRTDNTEQARIDSDGNFGIGSTNPTHKLHVQHNEDGAGVMRVQNNTNGGFAGIYFFQNNNYRGHIGYVNTGGSSGFAAKGDFQIAAGNRDFTISTNDTDELFSETVTFTQDKEIRLFDNSGVASPDFWDVFVDSFNDYNFGYNGTAESYIATGTGTYTTYSDRKLKDNIKPIEANTLDKILALNPVTYNYIKDAEKTKVNGFIAQEVQKLFPEVVDQKDDLLAIGYSSFGVLAIKAIQEQQVLIEELKARIDALESK